MTDRPYDLIVHGVTGYAGRLVADYLQRAHGSTLRWAVSGRREAAVQAIADDLERSHPEGGRPDVVVADNDDRASLDAMVRSTRAVCTTVGPYARWGAPLVAACIDAGTHYCDLTGEPTFVRAMIDAHHAEATEKGVAIVHCSGFDSVPSDLGTFHLQSHVLERDGAPCDRVEMVIKLKGGVSGGTIASMAQMLDDARDKAQRRILGDPYSLAPGHRGPDDRPQQTVRWSEAAHQWTAPFVMASINEKVVRRSNLLLGLRYGEGFRYDESMGRGDGLRGRLKALGLTAGLGAFAGAMASPRLRPHLMKRLPAPGEGPDVERLDEGFFLARFYGHRDGRVVACTEVRGQGDPGYGANACMIGEAARLLGTQGPSGVPGITTPAAALGHDLIARLHATRVQFTSV